MAITRQHEGYYGGPGRKTPPPFPNDVTSERDVAKITRDQELKNEKENQAKHLRDLENDKKEAEEKALQLEKTVARLQDTIVIASQTYESLKHETSDLESAKQTLEAQVKAQLEDKDSYEVSFYNFQTGCVIDYDQTPDSKLNRKFSSVPVECLERVLHRTSRLVQPQTDSLPESTTPSTAIPSRRTIPTRNGSSAGSNKRTAARRSRTRFSMSAPGAISRPMGAKK